MYEYVIYSFFNGEQIQAVLNAIVMLIGSGGVDGDYLGLVRTASILGTFLAVSYGLLRARGEDAAVYMVALAAFYSFLLVPRVSVTIQEANTGLVTAGPRTVDNVPMGLAFFASTTSKIGWWLTNQTETFFSYPDQNLKFSYHGLMGSSRALRETQSSTIADPVIKQNSVNFMRDCVNPELLNAPASLTALMSSKNIWSDINTLGLINPGRIVTFVSYSDSMDCQTAYTQLGTDLAGQATREQNRLALLLNPAMTATDANTTFAALLPAAEGLIMTASASAAEGVRQRMMINMLNESSSTLGQIMNDPSAVQAALAAAITTSSANTSYRTLARMASEALPMIRNSIELVILSLFPMMVIIVLIAGSKGGIVLRSYVMSLLWVQLWAPIYAVVHFVAQSTGAKSMKAALEGVDGVSVTNATSLINTTLSAEAVAGMLSISVPMIALALIKGGEVAMSGLTSSLLGPMQQGATKTGEHVGSGNVNAGNVSWGNYSSGNANVGQVGLSPSYDAGAYRVKDGYGGSTTDLQSGRVTGGNPENFMSGQAGVSYDSGFRRDNTSSSDQGARGTHDTGARLSESIRTGTTDATSGGTRRGDSTSSSHQYGGGKDFTSGLATQVMSDFKQAYQSGSSNQYANRNSADASFSPTAAMNGVGNALASNARSSGAPVSGSAMPGSNIPQSTAAPIAAGAAGLPQSAPTPTTGISGPLGNTPTPTTPSGPQPGSLPATLSGLAGKASQTVAGALRSVHVGVGGQKAQTITETASASNSGTTGSSYINDAKEVLSGMDKQIANISDSKEREAAQQFRAEFAKNLDSTFSSGHTLSEYSGASTSQSESSGNSVSASVRSGMSAWEAAAGTNNPLGARAAWEAVNLGPADLSAKLAGNAKDGSAQHLGSNGVAAPNGVGQVKADEANKVADVRADNNAAVAAQRPSDQAEAKRHQPVDPNSSPNTQPAQNSLEGAKDATSTNTMKTAAGTNLATGKAMAATYVAEQLRNGGISGFMSSAINSDSRPNSHQIDQLVGNIAANSPSFSAQLVESAKAGQLTQGAQAVLQQYAPQEWSKMTDPGGGPLDNLREKTQRLLNPFDTRQ